MELMMAKLQPTDFLGVDIGRLGTPSRVELPPELQGNWAPQGKSLEEINKTRQQIRDLNKEFNQKSAAGTVTATTTFITVSKNKKIFITAFTLSAVDYNVYTTGAAVTAGLEVYNVSGTAYRSLGRITLPPYGDPSGPTIWGPHHDSIALSFTNPVPINENETVRLVLSSDFNGTASVAIQMWEEDIII